MIKINMIYENPLKAYIDLKAFCHNINIVRSKFPDAKIILPVKANAYGHDDVIIAREAQKINVDYLGIARLSEGIKLRENKINLPIIDLGVENNSNIDLSFKYNIELSVSCIEHIKEIESKAKNKNIKVSVHLKIDTGMRRLGCNFDECLGLAEYINKSKYLKLKSTYTHFARSDDDFATTKKQAKIFIDFINLINKKNIKPDFFHCGNSGAILRNPGINFDSNWAVRPGIMSYGYSPIKSSDFGLLPVMTLKSKIINIKKVPKRSGVSYGHIYKTKKESYLATIALGYGDGFSRGLSNKFTVRINGKDYQQVGRISMDLTVVKVDANVKMGDEAVIFGNKSQCNYSADDLAKITGTISYEITTALNNRVERVIK